MTNKVIAGFVGVVWGMVIASTLIVVSGFGNVTNTYQNLLDVMALAI